MSNHAKSLSAREAIIGARAQQREAMIGARVHYRHTCEMTHAGATAPEVVAADSTRPVGQLTQAMAARKALPPKRAWPRRRTLTPIFYLTLDVT